MVGKKKVAIIGAGGAGLAAIKSCLEENLEPTCFEQYGTIGGTWYYTKEYRKLQGANVFDSVIQNGSRHMGCYSDFPYQSGLPPFVQHTEVHKYLKRYMKAFGLQRYILLNTKVTCVRRSRDYDVTGTWEVEAVTNNGSPEVQIFDCVMVCSGFYKKPIIPEIKGMETFQGEIQHSAVYKNGEKYKDKRVLVVGKANSSGDLAAGAAFFAEEVLYSVAEGMWVFPRFVENGMPYDYKLWTRANFRSIEKVDKLMIDLMTNRLSLQHCGFCPAGPPTMGRIMINDEVQTYVMNGKIKIHGRLVRLGPREAEFDDGSVVHDVDAVLFATGYELSLDFLEEKLIEENGKLSLYKMVFPLSLPHNTFALIGCQDIQGPILPVSELQTRLAARVHSGNHKLPPKNKWNEDIDSRNNWMFAFHGRYRYCMPYFPIRDELASELGVVPSWLDLIKAGPRLAYNYFYGPAFPFYDRIWGPHPWSGAKKAAKEALEHGYYITQPRPSKFQKLPRRSNWFPKVLILLAFSTVVIVKFKCVKKDDLVKFIGCRSG